MTGERPRLCPVEPLWDFLPDFHRYAARWATCWRAASRPSRSACTIRSATFGPTATRPIRQFRGHDALAQALLRRQCDFDIVDDDVLSDPTTRVENGRLAIGPMRYRTIVVGPTQWMTEASKKRLETFQAAGGQVVRVDDLGQIDAAVAKIAPTVQLDPPSPDIRVLVRRWPGGGAAFLFNEGQKAYAGTASIHLDGKLCEIEPATGLVRGVDVAGASGGRPDDPAESRGLAVDAGGLGLARAAATVAPPAAAQDRPVGRSGRRLDGPRRSAIRGGRARFRDPSDGEGGIQAGGVRPLGHNTWSRRGFLGPRDVSADGERSRVVAGRASAVGPGRRGVCRPRVDRRPRRLAACFGARGGSSCRR